MEMRAQLHTPVVFPKGQKHLILGGSRTGLDTVEKSKIFALSGNEP
jgi:hypothetical protein